MGEQQQHQQLKTYSLAEMNEIINNINEDTIVILKTDQNKQNDFLDRFSSKDKSPEEIRAQKNLTSRRWYANHKEVQKLRVDENRIQRKIENNCYYGVAGRPKKNAKPLVESLRKVVVA
jgi:hypothetical protein